MSGKLWTRRDLVTKGAATGGALVLAAAVPKVAEAAHYCGYQYGPIHRAIYGWGVDPAWQHDIIWRESNFDPGATNPSSGAAGLAQFMAGTWAWGQRRFGIYGSPYNWITNLQMMNAFLRVGEYYHWDL